MHLMPLMFAGYVIQYMDKSVLPQSAIYGLLGDINIQGQDYSWCSYGFSDLMASLSCTDMNIRSLFYFGYLAF